ncbi:hypothetical protein [Leifsonia sp. 21MFCrub1.1]|uniref:hypothetical protein n=1 Tax=Leifsonia sp. 21MFCrub1.1 TaxID=1798223 RepID=UPI0012FD8592|nr:hypothetical protein [Leifsonia sp. 21MFCrub1.1]
MELISQLDATLDSVHSEAREPADIDEARQDVAIEIARTLDKDRRFLFAHISE